MAISVACGACAKRYSVDDKVAGKKVKCKHCGNVFTALPQGAAPAARSQAASISPAYVSSRSVPSAGSSSRSAAAPAARAPVSHVQADDPIPFRDDEPDFDSIASLADGPSADDLSPGAPIPMSSPPMNAAPLAAPPPGAYAAPAYATPAYAVPAYSPAVAYAANKQRNRSGGGSTFVSVGKVLLTAGILIGVVIVINVLAFIFPSFAKPAFIMIIIMGALLVLLGGLMGIFVAFGESGTCGLLYLIVPFYRLYYLVSRWSEMKTPFLTNVIGVVLMLGALPLVAMSKAQIDRNSRLSSSGSSSDDDSPGSPSMQRGGGSRSFASPGGGNAFVQSAPPVPTDQDADRAERLRSRASHFAANRIDRRSREEATRELADLKSEANANQARYESKPAWPEITSLLAASEARVSALPSEVPATTLFQELPLSATWKNDASQDSQLAPEVSFNNYKLRPLLETLVDLSSSETDAGGLVFKHSKRGSDTIRLKTYARTDVRQKRPWVAAHSFEVDSAKKNNLFAINAVDANPTVSLGRINGLAFTRIEADSSKAFISRWVKYVALDGNNWIEIELTGAKDDAQSVAALEMAAKTFRKATSTETKVDPFTPELVAGRLAREFDKVAPILRKAGPAAEPILFNLLNGSDNALRDAAAKLLPDLATAKSTPELTKLADSKDEQVATAARTALKRLAPGRWDAVSDALSDLKGDNIFKKRDALDVLATATPDAARRPAIATLLEDIILSDNSSFDQEKAGKALAVWAGDKTYTRLLPLVTDEHGAPWKKKAAIIALGGTKDKRAATAILNWIVKEPQSVVAAAITIGPACEDAILAMQLLRNRDAKVRSNAAQILSEIGTVKCYQELIRASKDTRDAPAAAVAQAAMDGVKERMKKPATKPAL